MDRIAACILKRIGYRKFYYKMVSVFIISIIISTFSASLTYYGFSINRAIKQVENENNAVMSLAITTIERILEGVEQDSLQLAGSKYLNEAANGLSFVNDVDSLLNIMKEIQMCQVNNGYIENICFYSRTIGGSFIASHGFVPEPYSYLSTDVKSAFGAVRSAGWMVMPASNPAGKIAYVRKLPVFEQSPPQSIIIIYADMNKLTDILVQNLNLSDIQTAYIIDSNGEILLKAENGRKTDGINDKNTIESICSTGLYNRNFTGENDNGQRCYYTVAGQNSGRVYISSVLRKEILGKSMWVFKITLLSILLPMCIGVLITVLLSKRIYNPLNELVRYSADMIHESNIAGDNEFTYIKDCFYKLKNKSDTLNDYVKSLENVIKKDFLIRLLTGKYEEKDVNEDCSKFSIPTDRAYIVMTAYLERQSEIAADLPDLLLTDATNIMAELMSCEHNLINGSIVCINNMPAAILYFSSGMPQKEIISSCLAYARDVNRYTGKYLNLDIYIGFGSIYCDAVNLKDSYREAIEALNVAFTNKETNISIFKQEDCNNKQAMLLYPHEIQKAIIDALMDGDICEACRSLSEFTDAVSSSEFHGFSYQLYFILFSHIVSSFEDGGNNILDLLQHNFFGQFRNCRTHKEFGNWYCFIFFPLYIELNRHASMAGNNCIPQILKHINENINGDITLLQCAELVNMNPSYISRLFKKETGMSFIDYLTKCKIDAVKRLLKETEFSIEAIASIVGYSERNLYRNFLKHTRLSPNEYRNRNR